MSAKIKSNENIQVYVRCRPINSRERQIHSHEMVKVQSDREVIVKQTGDSRVTKKFTFDRAFGPESKQSDVYHVIVAPLINEVLSGYNCTVFAYGQTGTGKTHTMIGDESPQSGSSYEDSSAMGIIPRALSHLFEELRSTELEFSMRISYLELYNEELSDLLSSSEMTQIRIFEDPNKKGSIIVQGLEEIPVHSTADVYKLLAKGQEKRKMAATLMNAQSSRSHTVFSILVHIKENGIDGEELMKIGKLNLVDLAGSENISKAGNEKGIRTRETVNINQSLLTLGRVITALVERTPHVPYRESKLTRLLQESLGGRTKTSIIATISPGHKDLEETMSTLEYANRAKNIQNKPEINQKLTKKTVLKEYTEEIDRLKRDLMAARDKNGVYLAEETYNQMQYQIDSQNREITDQITKLKAQKEELSKRQEQMNEISVELEKKTDELKTAEEILNENKEKLEKAKRGYQEKKHLLDKHKRTEDILTKQAKQLIDVANTATKDIGQLHATISRRKDYDYNNVEACKNLDFNMNGHFSKMAANLKTFSTCFNEITSSLIKKMDSNTKQGKAMYDASIANLRVLIECEKEGKALIDGYVDRSASDFAAIFTKHADEADNINGMAAERRMEFTKQLDELQASLLQTFTRFNLDIVRMSELVTENSNTVSEFCNSIAQTMQNNSDMVVSQLKTYRQNLDETYSANDKVSSAMENLIDQFKLLISQSRSNNETIISVAHNLGSDEQRIQQELGNNLKTIDNFNIQMANEITSMTSKLDECDQIVKTINTRTDEIVNISKTHELKSTGCMEELQTTFNTQKTSLTNGIEEMMSKVVDQCEIMKINIDAGLESVIHEMTMEHERIDTSKADFDDVMQNLESTQSEYHQKLSENIDVCAQRLDQFQKAELKIYQSTGDTPSKRDYVYPKALASTSPHDKIIKDFWRRHNPEDLNCSAIETITEEVKIVELTVVNEEQMERSELSDTVCSTERTLCENRTLNINMASTPIFSNIKKVVPMQDVSNFSMATPLEDDKEN